MHRGASLIIPPSLFRLYEPCERYSRKEREEAGSNSSTDRTLLGAAARGQRPLGGGAKQRKVSNAFEFCLLNRKHIHTVPKILYSKL